MFKLLWFLFLELIAPPFCVGCGCYGSLLCKKCYSQIQFMSISPDLEALEGKVDQLWVMGWYQGVLKKMILALKYQKVKCLGEVLGKMLYWTMDIPKVDVVTFVPSSKKRLRDRGYNQVQEIGKFLAENLGVECVKLVEKNQETVRQASLHSQEERAENLRGAFEIGARVNRKKLKGARVLLVDDVVTTGSTLGEVGLVLKQAGVSKVVGLVVAHGI
jgi:competence protein ComFC